MNEGDGVLRGVGEPQARELVLVDFAPVPGSSARENWPRVLTLSSVTPRSGGSGSESAGARRGFG